MEMGQDTAWMRVISPLWSVIQLNSNLIVLFLLFYPSLCSLLPSVRFLHLIRPFMAVLPEIAAPERKVCLLC